VKSMTPAQIVAELDRHIVGQAQAKRAVAIALRNRWRRRQLEPSLRDEVTPKNLILIGPTGVGKTEIARRLAKLVQAPFVKVEASKFTEVGYVGRDVESMVRDLVEAAVVLVREESKARVARQAKEAAEDRLAELLKGKTVSSPFGVSPAVRLSDPDREKLRAQLDAGTLDDTSVEFETADSPMSFMRQFSGQGVEEVGLNLQELFRNMPGGQRTKKRKMLAREALSALEADEAQRLVDSDRVSQEAVARAESDGIIFLDEVDKIASRDGATGQGPDVSREGVQRDLLPIVEGSTVTTKYGPVKTDHMLFIAAGAFHVSKPSDLIPELQGRFPVRVELEPLGQADLVRILTEPKASLVRQYQALLSADGVSLEFTEGALLEVARVAQHLNQRTQDIGARRLHTVLERLLDEVAFSAPDMHQKRFCVDTGDVQRLLSALLTDEDLSRYIL
jgi:ATP-dependent HslUV protease ATP-binding subunit HslU